MFKPKKKSIFQTLLIKLHIKKPKPRTIGDVVRDAFVTGSISNYDDHISKGRLIHPYAGKIHVTELDKDNKLENEYLGNIKEEREGKFAQPGSMFTYGNK